MREEPWLAVWSTVPISYQNSVGATADPISKFEAYERFRGTSKDIRATQYLCGGERVRRRARWSGRWAQERGGESQRGGGTPTAPPQQRLPSRCRCGQTPKQAYGIKLANPRRGGEGRGAHEIKLGVRGPGGWTGVECGYWVG